MIAYFTSGLLNLLILELIVNFNKHIVLKCCCYLLHKQTNNHEPTGLLLLFIDHTPNGTQYIYTIHIEYKHVHTKHIYKYIRINRLQSILMKVSIFDLVKPSMLYISHFANKSILRSEIIICCSLSNGGGRITFLTHTSGKMSIP